MSLLSIILIVIVILVVVFVAVIVIDKTFTGPALEFAWLAKILVGILGLVALAYALSGSGLIHLS